ncbi:hypothetical protein RhiirA5_427491 [Rhizophagus irregularis]|uniref:Uncharacterized protein n=1 Tax=Rhizophagus irregularis TaxID=588596 RepID=A0A2N0P275_9GLOM|nr:hypothetical protein RhiirA5_427491 [Rhizophagus irregularis]
MSMDKSRTTNEEALDFVSKFNKIYFQTFTHHLRRKHVLPKEFLNKLKNPSVPKDKAQLLIQKFGETANPANFTSQAQATNIQPTTLSLIFSIALYAASRSWDNFSAQLFCEFGDMGDDDDDDEDESQNTDDYLINMSPLLLDEDDLKKDKQKARVTADKQITNQSTKAKPDVKTSAKNSHKGKKSSEPEATQILTGYETVGEEQERIRDIIVYDIPYIWDLQKILAVKTLGERY